MKRIGGYNGLINVLEKLLIQMEEPILPVNGAAVGPQAANVTVH